MSHKYELHTVFLNVYYHSLKKNYCTGISVIILDFSEIDLQRMRRATDLFEESWRLTEASRILVIRELP